MNFILRKTLSILALIYLVLSLIKFFELFNLNMLSVYQVIGLTSAVLAAALLLLFSYNLKGITLGINKLKKITGRGIADNVALSYSDIAKNESLSISAHQLKSPMTAILGYATMIRDGSFGLIKDTQMEAIQKIETSSLQLLINIEMTLNISKYNQGELDIYKQDIYISKVFELVKNKLKPYFFQKNSTLNIEIKNDISLYIGRDQIILALASLIIELMCEYINIEVNLKATITKKGTLLMSISRVKKSTSAEVSKELCLNKNDLVDKNAEIIAKLHGGSFWPVSTETSEYYLEL